MAMVTRTACDW